MDVTPLVLAHDDLVGYEAGFDYWVFAPFDFKPSYWLILNRDGFSGDLVGTSEELDDLTCLFGEEELRAIYRASGTEPDGYFWTSTLRSELEQKILSGCIQVFNVNAKTVIRLADGKDTIYSSPDSQWQPMGDPITDLRNQLAETLGRDIITRWKGKDAADRVHWDRSWISREAVEAVDLGGTVVDTVVDAVVGLWDLGKLVVHLAGEVLEMSLDIAKLEYNFARMLVSGDIEGIKSELDSLGIAFGDALDSAEKFSAKVKLGYSVF